MPSHEEQTRRSKFPVVAGIFEIGVACASLLMSSFATVAVMLILVRENGIVLGGDFTFLLAIGMFWTITSIVGLMGGIFAIKRKHFFTCLAGVLLFIGEGASFVWLSFSNQSQSYSSFIQGFMMGNAEIVISILSLAFLLTSKAEFTQPYPHMPN